MAANPHLKSGDQGGTPRERAGMVLLEEAAALFGDTPRPAHFTDYRHCCECAEHDETLRAQTPATLGLDHLRPGWDPLCFITPEGFQYYFPALVRLALDDVYFIDQLVFHLEYDGRDNLRYLQFTPAQRDFVVRLLTHLVETRADEIEQNFDADALLRALEIWAQ